MMPLMRTTVTLTPEADALVRKSMRERGLTFKEAVNEAIVAGLTPDNGKRQFNTPAFNLGRARVPIEKALQLAGELEDEELLRKTSLGK